MDYSALNHDLWDPMIQLGLVAIFILLANIIRRKVPAIRKSMIPTAVLAGFIVLALKWIGIVKIDVDIMEILTYHGIAIGFIALSLRVPEKNEMATNHIGMRSGALIVSTYMIQGFFGLLITIGLAYSLMPNLFKASGILLPMGYGQGPGQANNIGSSYEALGFVGGRSFGLAIAAAGYLCACIVGVAYLNVLNKRGQLPVKKEEGLFEESVNVSTFQDENEAPISESIDRLSIQVCLVFLVYVITFLATKGVTGLLSSYAPAVGNLLNSLLWGFNFIIGTGFAILTRTIMQKARDVHWMNHQYQNNYLMSRISGLAFDVMIVAGIASINFEELSGLWLPFILLVVVGAIVTLLQLKFVCKRIYGEYYYEGLISMYGMMTGTISSGVLLLREVDPMMKTPAANNLVIGSSFAILFGAPFLVAVSLAPKSDMMTLIILGAVALYYFLLTWLAVRKTKKQ